MSGFRMFVGLLWLVLIAFTAVVVARDGLALLPVFFGAIADGHWPGQFNADFLTLLCMSGLWTAWRGGFTLGSVLLGVVAFFMGGGFLLGYLLWLSWREDGNVRRMLLGVHDKGT